MAPAGGHHTYIAGEDEGRLATAAQDMGLHQYERRRTPKTSWSSILFSDDTLAAAVMHSVGTLGADERVDQYGTLMSVRRKREMLKKPEYGQLPDLFAKPAIKPEYEGLATAQEAGEEEEEEEEEVMVVEGGSLGAAGFGILKGTVGPAILYLPRGVYVSGYAVAMPAMIVATSFFIYSAYRLLDCWKLESDKNHQVESRLKEVQSLLQQSSQNESQYGSTSVQQDRFFTPKLLTYPELAKRALGQYALLVEIGIMSFQFGVVLTYLIFVPQNLYECTHALFGGVFVPKIYFLLAMIAIEIPLSWIRDIRKLTPTNVIASLLIAFGLISVLFMAFLQGTDQSEDSEQTMFEENLTTLPALTEKWFLFIGTSFFMMEGSITLVIPLQEAVFRPEDKKNFPDLNRNVTSSVVVFYFCFSLICCAAFGSSIKTALTASLQGTLATVVQAAYSIAVILTHPLQAFPAMEVAIRLLDRSLGTDASSSGGWRRNVYATLITLLLGLIAIYAIDYLGNVVSILGSLFGIPLALVFPPIMHNMMIKDSPWTTRWFNYGVVVIGFFAMGAASYNTIITWNEGADR